MLTTSYTYENEAQISADLKCSICFEPFRLPIRDVYCGHTFCFRCIKTWLDFKRKQSCPICRQHFTKFVQINDEEILQGLDQLTVTCSHCDQTNIKREDIRDHIVLSCSKTIFTGHEEYKENVREQVYFEYLLKQINESIENHPEEAFYEQVPPIPLPLWIAVISGIHLFFYMCILVPVAVLLNVIDVGVYLLRCVIELLIRITQLRI